MSQGRARAAVLGAGTWGTALALHLDRLGWRVCLWGRDARLVKEIRETGENARYLTGVPLSPAILATADFAEALDRVDIAIVAVPSAFVESAIAPMRDGVPLEAVVVSATKGLEPRDGHRMSWLLGEILPGRPLAVLSGPSFGREVALGLPTALVIASCDENVSRRLQGTMSAPAFRLYTNRDVVGVEIAGALKNVVAIATGLADGLGLGENARAALITRGLAEIVRLGVALGAQPSTFLGLAGLGDLVLTCTGSLSRNRALGREVARGRSVDEVESGTRTIAEGVRTVSSALKLARGIGCPMPICQEVGAVLFERKPVRQALQSLLSREPRPEEEMAWEPGG